jgi:hypothetical protein
MYDVCTMRRTNIYLADEQLAGLRGVADRRGVTVAAVVREAVDEWLARNGVQSVPPDEWSRRFGSLLTRREEAARAGGWEQDEVDREVAQAVNEVRRTRAASRR